MFMNWVHEQRPKIDSGTIPSQNESKIGRVHRVHSPRPARAPRPRACRAPAAHAPRARRAAACRARAPACCTRDPAPRANACHARPCRAAPCARPARPACTRSRLLHAQRQAPVSPAPAVSWLQWLYCGLAGHCIAIQSSLA